MNSEAPKIILVDDHEIFRDGLKTLLELNNIGKVIYEASNGKEFLEILPKQKPDIVLIDIDMPVMNGIEATRKAIGFYSDLQILALSMFGDQQYYYDMIDAGAKGFILKSSGKAELLKAIHSVLNGNSYFSEELLFDIMNKLGISKRKKNLEFEINFNPKELEIIRLLSQGFSSDEIAEKVSLSIKTVTNYRANMLEKTGCSNSTSLVIYAIKNNLISI